MQCILCLINTTWNAHNRESKYCLECKVAKRTYNKVLLRKVRGLKYPYLLGFTGRDRTREKVRERDNRICQDCGKKWESGKRRFDVHHLNGLCGKKSLSYDKMSEMEGLITLCHKCHYNRPEHRSNKKLSTF
jgi:hypothetical protein